MIVDNIYFNAIPKKCFGVVYTLTNLANGKVYVGVCKTGRIKTRLAVHRGSKTREIENCHLFHALQQDDFRHDVIDYAETREELFAKETEHIKRLKSYDDECGYNLTMGGDGRLPYFRPFEEAREYIHKMKFKSSSEFYPWAASDKRPKDIPANPWVTYKGIGWTTWKDFIGRGRKPRNVPWKTFEESRAFVRKANLDNPGQITDRSYRKWVRHYWDIPLHPDRVYKEEWQGWGDYLGTICISPNLHSREHVNKNRTSDRCVFCTPTLAVERQPGLRPTIRSATSPSESFPWAELAPHPTSWPLQDCL